MPVRSLPGETVDHDAAREIAVGHRGDGCGDTLRAVLERVDVAGGEDGGTSSSCRTRSSNALAISGSWRPKSEIADDRDTLG